MLTSYLHVMVLRGKCAVVKKTSYIRLSIDLLWRRTAPSKWTTNMMYSPQRADKECMRWTQCVICVQVQHVGMHRSQYHYVIGSLVSHAVLIHSPVRNRPMTQLSLSGSLLCGPLDRWLGLHCALHSVRPTVRPSVGPIQAYNPMTKDYRKFN